MEDMDMIELMATVSDKGRSEQVVAVAKNILEANRKTSAENTMSGKDIYGEYRSKLGDSHDDEIPRNTFIQCLSVASKSPGTQIFCKGRKQGYYYSTEPQVVSDVTDDCADEVVKGEATLYPYFRDWLVAKGYKSRIIAERKKNRKWGNPDVLGVKFTNVLGRVQEELVSIECKRDLTDWKKYIFEAVAHKRFVDRSYFAFAYQEDAAQKILPEMMQYAEYYGIGILLLELPREMYGALLKGVSVDEEEIEVQEIYPAKCQPPILDARVDFFNKINVSSVTGLYEFVASEN